MPYKQRYGLLPYRCFSYAGFVCRKKALEKDFMPAADRIASKFYRRLTFDACAFGTEALK